MVILLWSFCFNVFQVLAKVLMKGHCFMGEDAIGNHFLFKGDF